MIIAHVFLTRVLRATSEPECHTPPPRYRTLRLSVLRVACYFLTSPLVSPPASAVHVARTRTPSISSPFPPKKKNSTTCLTYSIIPILPPSLYYSHSLSSAFLAFSNLVTFVPKKKRNKGLLHSFYTPFYLTMSHHKHTLIHLRASIYLPGVA